MGGPAEGQERNWLPLAMGVFMVDDAEVVLWDDAEPIGRQPAALFSVQAIDDTCWFKLEDRVEMRTWRRRWVRQVKREEPRQGLLER